MIWNATTMILYLIRMETTHFLYVAINKQSSFADNCLLCAGSEAFFIQMPIYDITYHSNERTNHSTCVVCCYTLLCSYKISIRSSIACNIPNGNRTENKRNLYKKLRDFRMWLITRQRSTSVFHIGAKVSGKTRFGARFN